MGRESFFCHGSESGTKWGHDCVCIANASLVLSAVHGENPNMASLENRNGSFRVVFRYAGQKFGHSLRTKNEETANGSLARLVDNLRRVELGTLQIPEDADIAAFLLSDGGRISKPKSPTIRNLHQLCERYFQNIGEDSLEKSTISGMKTHASHLKRILGMTFPFRTLQLEDLQGYVDERSKDKGLRKDGYSADDRKGNQNFNVGMELGSSCRSH